MQDSGTYYVQATSAGLHAKYI